MRGGTKASPLRRAIVPMFAFLTLASLQPTFAHGDKAHGEAGREELNALYSAYLDMHKALFQDDFPAARGTVRTLLRSPRKYPAELSHGVAARDLLADLRALAAASDIGEFRREFQAFSERMILLMSEAANAGDRPVLVYHCPMVEGKKGGKGANWMQATQETENPYFGKEMSRCGRMVKTLHKGVPRNETPGEPSRTGDGRGHHGTH